MDKTVVQSHALVVEETRVIAWYGSLHALAEQEAAWVHPQVKSIAKNIVAKRTDLNTDILGDHLLDQVRE